MRAYKTFNTAQKHANGGLIVKCGEFYIIGMRSYDDIALMQSDGQYIARTSPGQLQASDLPIRITDYKTNDPHHYTQMA